VTLKDLPKLEKIAREAAMLGYDKKNIHIVWVVNDIEVAQQQNKARARTVPSEILVNTHRGAANTMGDIITCEIWQRWILCQGCKLLLREETGQSTYFCRSTRQRYQTKDCLLRTQKRRLDLTVN
jgi:hypothetical protein